MDSAIAFIGKDFVMMLADASQARSIVKMKGDVDKLFVLDSHKMLALTGECGDRENFANYIQKNMHLYALRYAWLNRVRGSFLCAMFSQSRIILFALSLNH